jgi:flavin-dependent dehydrogenase
VGRRRNLLVGIQFDPEVPVPPISTDHRPSHAVVIGAGLGGLVAAQALSRHVERVTLVERDDLPGRPTQRSGTSPCRHVHLVRPGALAAIERLLPGFEAELVASGAVRIETPRDLGDQRVVLSATRDLVEWVTRRLVLETPQIIVRSGLEVTGLAVTEPPGPGAGRVRGVEVWPRGAATAGPTESIVAELVVDASGRRSQAPDWLTAAGYEWPAESSVDAGVSYATRIYRRCGGDAGGPRALFLQPRPPETRRMGVLVPIENDRWMLTVAGANGDVPPTDEHGFGEFLRGLRAPKIAEAVDGLEPLSPIVGHRRTGYLRRYYESLRRMPDGFVVVGDATCAFDPVYGQEMSAAAFTAEALDRCLAEHLSRRRDLSGLSAVAQKAVAAANAGAWVDALDTTYAAETIETAETAVTTETIDTLT